MSRMKAAGVGLAGTDDVCRGRRQSNSSPPERRQERRRSVNPHGSPARYQLIPRPQAEIGSAACRAADRSARRRFFQGLALHGTGIMSGAVCGTGLLAVGFPRPRAGRAGDRRPDGLRDSRGRDPSRSNVSRCHEQNVTFPGNVQAFVETPIYARTAGYLTKWYVDIGGKVQAGQLLAVIDTPEVDQQLRQAEAAQLQAQANLDLAKTTAERWQEPVESRMGCPNRKSIRTCRPTRPARPIFRRPPPTSTG